MKPCPPLSDARRQLLTHIWGSGQDYCAEMLMLGTRRVRLSKKVQAQKRHRRLVFFEGQTPSQTPD